jgi:membrane-bound ClpP family serine protease
MLDHWWPGVCLVIIDIHSQRAGVFGILTACLFLLNGIMNVIAEISDMEEVWTSPEAFGIRGTTLIAHLLTVTAWKVLTRDTRGYQEESSLATEKRNHFFSLRDWFQR